MEGVAQQNPAAVFTKKLSMYLSTKYILNFLVNTAAVAALPHVPHPGYASHANYRLHRTPLISKLK